MIKYANEAVINYTEYHEILKLTIQKQQAVEEWMKTEGS